MKIFGLPRILHQWAILAFLIAGVSLFPKVAYSTPPSLEGSAGWIGENGPIASPDLHGKVVLFDFWDYTCINCIRTFPHLNALYERYRSKGLIIVAIHSPEFSFAKDPARIQNAIRTYHLAFPVLMDKDHRLWDRFRNHYWPADYLYDREGHLVYHAFGEGGYDILEAQVRQALHLPDHDIPAEDSSFPAGLTPELYTGYDRGRLGNPSGYHPDHAFRYEGRTLPPSTILLHGEWSASPDHLSAQPTGSDHASTLSVIYRGRGVNAVLKRPSPKAHPVIMVLLDGKPVPKRYFGRDIRPLSSGQTRVRIERARMYSLVSDQPFGVHRIDLVFPDTGTEIYTLTFNP